MFLFFCNHVEYVFLKKFCFTTTSHSFSSNVTHFLGASHSIAKSGVGMSVLESWNIYCEIVTALLSHGGNTNAKDLFELNMY